MAPQLPAGIPGGKHKGVPHSSLQACDQAPLAAERPHCSLARAAQAKPQAWLACRKDRSRGPSRRITSK